MLNPCFEHDPFQTNCLFLLAQKILESNLNHFSPIRYLPEKFHTKGDTCINNPSLSPLSVYKLRAAARVARDEGISR